MHKLFQLYDIIQTAYNGLITAHDDELTIVIVI